MKNEIFDKKVELHKRFGNISFKEIKRKDNLIIEVKQGKSHAENYHSKERLMEIAHELYDEIYETFHVSAIPYEPPLHDVVNSGWLRHQMTTKGLKSKNVIKILALDKTTFSAHLNNIRPIGNTSQAMYFYFFKSI